MGKSVGLQGQQSYRPGPHKIATREQENSLGQEKEAGETQVSEPSAQLLFFVTEDLSIARAMLPSHRLNQDQLTRGMIYRFSDWKPECPPDSGE